MGREAGSEASFLVLAAQLLRAGRPADAIGPLRAALRCAPGNADILHDLGLACLQAGRVAEAIATLQACIAADPNGADAHLRLGIALEAEGALDQALGAYATAAVLLPAPADAFYRAGRLLESLARTTEAITAYRRAAVAAPETTLGRVSTARALLVADRDSEAEAVLRQALALEAGNPVVQDMLGNVLAESGCFAEARALLLAAIDSAPLLAGSYYEVVRCRRLVPGDAPLVVRMQAAVSLPGLEPAQRSRVHLALGKAAQDLGDHRCAMQHFDAADMLRNPMARFDPGVFEARVDRLIGCFGAGDTPHPLPALRAGPIPILIMGLPRSGTTLVEQILSAHSAVQAGGELSFWNESGGAWERAGALSPGQEFLAAQQAAYARLLQATAPGAAYVTDKMPLNFQWAGLVHRAVPHAVMVHCRRSPIDTALSIHQTHFNPRMAFPTGGEALVGYVRAYQRLCAHWRAVLPPDRFIELDYEALTGAPEPMIRHLLQACGLEWDAACLRPELNRRVVKTPSKWQARQPIYRHAVESWRAYESCLGPLRALLGVSDGELTKE